MFDKIFYINLDHRTDRKEEIERELDNMGLLSNAERHSAFYFPSIGGVGCGRSHIDILKKARDRGYSQILILEDDFTFVVSKEEFSNSINKLVDKEFDVCLISYNLRDGKVVDDTFTKVLDAQTTSGYIVRSHYYDALIEIFEAGVEMLEKTNHHWLYSIDQIWKKLQPDGNWICFTERLGVQRPSYSDCTNRFENYKV